MSYDTLIIFKYESLQVIKFDKYVTIVKERLR